VKGLELDCPGIQPFERADDDTVFVSPRVKVLQELEKGLVEPGGCDLGQPDIVTPSSAVDADISHHHRGVRGEVSLEKEDYIVVDLRELLEQAADCHDG